MSVHSGFLPKPDCGKPDRSTHSHQSRIAFVGSNSLDIVPPPFPRGPATRTFGQFCSRPSSTGGDEEKFYLPGFDAHG